MPEHAHDLLQQAQRNLRKGLGKRSLNELLALHLSIVVVVASIWGVTTWTGPAGLHHVFRLIAMFYAFFGWVAMRIWNQHAWRKHFRPKAQAKSTPAKTTV